MIWALVDDITAMPKPLDQLQAPYAHLGSVPRATHQAIRASAGKAGNGVFEVHRTIENYLFSLPLRLDRPEVPWFR